MKGAKTGGLGVLPHRVIVRNALPVFLRKAVAALEINVEVEPFCYLLAMGRKSPFV